MPEKGITTEHDEAVMDEDDVVEPVMAAMIYEIRKCK